MFGRIYLFGERKVQLKSARKKKATKVFMIHIYLCLSVFISVICTCKIWTLLYILKILFMYGSQNNLSYFKLRNSTLQFLQSTNVNRAMISSVALIAVFSISKAAAFAPAPTHYTRQFIKHCVLEDKLQSNTEVAIFGRG